MLKKKIKYTDYNDINREQEFRFNLSQAELTEMEMTTYGGLTNKIDKITETQDVNEIFKLFKEVIFKSYGELAPDGIHFVKSEAISIAFSQTEAYNNLVVEMITDSKAAAEFINGIIPQPNPNIK